MLRRCLTSLLEQKITNDTTSDISLTVSLLVIENDTVAHAPAIITSLEANAPFKIRHHLEPDIGIAQARNRALKEALLLNGDWLWFIDDDEIADPDCLQQLFQTAYEFDAEVVQGKVLYEYPASDKWAQLSKFGEQNAVDGKEMHTAATNNTLLSSRLFAGSGLGLYFDPLLRVSGGEDTLFFKKAYANKVKIVFSESAIVREPVSESRCSLGFILDRQARITATAVYADRKVLGETKALAKHRRRLRQNLVQATVNMLVAPFASLLKPNQSRYYFLKALLKVATLRGRWRGLRGNLYKSYNIIHGN